MTRLEITSRDEVAGGQSFGSAGPYVNIRGRVHGELDPRDRRNRIIQDIDLAPRNARGRVDYVATFSLMMPADLSKSSGVLVYSVVNRGNGAATPGPEGHISLVSGWQGDVTPTATNQTIQVPVARNARWLAADRPGPGAIQRFAEGNDYRRHPHRIDGHGFLSAGDAGHGSRHADVPHWRDHGRFDERAGQSPIRANGRSPTAGRRRSPELPIRRASA